jgi:hypothetical protein
MIVAVQNHVVARGARLEKVVCRATLASLYISSVKNGASRCHVKCAKIDTCMYSAQIGHDQGCSLYCHSAHKERNSTWFFKSPKRYFQSIECVQHEMINTMRLSEEYMVQGKDTGVCMIGFG